MIFPVKLNQRGKNEHFISPSDMDIPNTENPKWKYGNKY